MSPKPGQWVRRSKKKIDGEVVRIFYNTDHPLVAMIRGDEWNQTEHHIEVPPSWLMRMIYNVGGSGAIGPTSKEIAEVYKAIKDGEHDFTPVWYTFCLAYGGDEYDIDLGLSNTIAFFFDCVAERHDDLRLTDLILEAVPEYRGKVGNSMENHEEFVDLKPTDIVIRLQAAGFHYIPISRHPYIQTTKGRQNMINLYPGL